MIGTLLATAAIALIVWGLLRTLGEQLDDDAESLRRHEAAREALRRSRRL